MILATDNQAGNNIMSGIYRKIINERTLECTNSHVSSSQVSSNCPLRTFPPIPRKVTNARQRCRRYSQTAVDQRGIDAPPWRLLGAHLGTRQGTPADIAVTCGNLSSTAHLLESPPPVPIQGHTVHGMQGVRGSNPLSSTRHNASAALPLRAVCQQIVSRARHVTAITL
jgi:hypothetical protein